MINKIRKYFFDKKRVCEVRGGVRIPKNLKNQAFYLKEGMIFTKQYDIFDEIVEYNASRNIPSYYHDCNNWSLKNYYSERYEAQLKFIEEKFVPLINSEDVICDIGCASGDFSFIFAKYCKLVEGFDFSQKLVNNAIELAKENNITNAFFYNGACETIKYQKEYDKASLMGVLTCIMNDNEALASLKKLYDALKPGGYLIYKDNSNESNNDYYFFGPRKDYKMIARSKNKIFNLMKGVGFKIVEEKYFHRLEIETLDKEYDNVKIISLGLLLKKI